MTLDRRFTRLSANIQYTDTAMQQRHTIDSAVQLGAGVIAWQEVHTQDAKNYIEKQRGHTTHWPGGVLATGTPKANQMNAVPISWRDAEWTFEQATLIPVDVPGDDNDARAGVTPPRFVPGVRLIHRATGLAVVHVNTHLVRTIDAVLAAIKAGKSLSAEWKWIRGAHAAGMEAFIRQMRAWDDDPVIGSGDFNTVNFPALIAGHGITAEKPNKPTHGTRTIDWFAIRDPRSKIHVSQRPATKPLGNSDHRAVLLTADIPIPATDPEEHPMKLVTRAEWGATARGATRTSHPIGSTKGITCHWEGPGMGGFPHEQCARKVQTIQRFHKETRGWADIAYNAIVCPHGFVFEGRGPGVKSAANGFESVNEDWYAVCYLGGVGDPFTEAAKEAFLDSFGWLAREGDAGPKRNGHRDHKSTACPGDAIYRWVHSLPDGAMNGNTNNEKDWFDMATQQELRAIVREEVKAALADLPNIQVVDPANKESRMTLARLLFRGKRSDDIVRSHAHKES